MKMDDKETDQLYTAAKNIKSGEIPTDSPYPETKWGPDREHPIVFEEGDNSKVRKFFEGKEHLKEVYPGVTKGMLINFAVNGALFDPVTQMPSDMKDNYKAMADVMSEKNFSYEKEAGKLEKYGIDSDNMKVLVEKAYLVSDAFKERAVKSLGYDKLENMSPEHRKQYDYIVERAADSGEFLRVQNDVLVGGSQYSNVNLLLQSAEKALADGEIEDEDAIEFVQDVIVNTRSAYPGGKPDDKDGIAYVVRNEKLDIGLDVMTHEMSHYVYNQTSINPNSNVKDRETSYGKENSPLNQVNKDKVKFDLLYLINNYKLDLPRARAVIHPKTEEEKELSANVIDHDNIGYERAADIHGVRMQMFKEGIYNPFDGSDVTPEQVEKFMKAHPESRIFRYWDEKSSQFFLNNIAFNESLRETVGKNILAAIDEDDKEINAMRGNSFGKGVDAPSVAAANMAASSFQQIYDENIGRGQDESRGLSV